MTVDLGPLGYGARLEWMLLGRQASKPARTPLAIPVVVTAASDDRLLVRTRRELRQDGDLFVEVYDLQGDPPALRERHRVPHSRWWSVPRRELANPSLKSFDLLASAADEARVLVASDDDEVRPWLEVVQNGTARVGVVGSFARVRSPTPDLALNRMLGLGRPSLVLDTAPGQNVLLDLDLDLDDPFLDLTLTGRREQYHAAHRSRPIDPVWQLASGRRAPELPSSRDLVRPHVDAAWLTELRQTTFFRRPEGNVVTVRGGCCTTIMIEREKSLEGARGQAVTMTMESNEGVQYPPRRLSVRDGRPTLVVDAQGQRTAVKIDSRVNDAPFSLEVRNRAGAQVLAVGDYRDVRQLHGGGSFTLLPGRSPERVELAAVPGAPPAPEPQSSFLLVGSFSDVRIADGRAGSLIGDCASPNDARGLRVVAPAPATPLPRLQAEHEDRWHRENFVDRVPFLRPGTSASRTASYPEHPDEEGIRRGVNNVNRVVPYRGRPALERSWLPWSRQEGLDPRVFDEFQVMSYLAQNVDWQALPTARPKYQAGWQDRSLLQGLVPEIKVLYDLVPGRDVHQLMEGGQPFLENAELFDQLATMWGELALIDWAPLFRAGDYSQWFSPPSGASSSRASFGSLHVDWMCRQHWKYRGVVDPLLRQLGFPESMLPPVDVASNDEAAFERWCRGGTPWDVFARQELAPRRWMLLHGDVHRGNLMCRPDGRIVPIDWELALPGDPALDVAVAAVRLGLDERQITNLCKAIRRRAPWVFSRAGEGGSPQQDYDAFRRDVAMLVVREHAKSFINDLWRVGERPELRDGLLHNALVLMEANGLVPARRRSDVPFGTRWHSDVGGVVDRFVMTNRGTASQVYRRLGLSMITTPGPSSPSPAGGESVLR